MSMDLQTEIRLAKLLMEEATRLRVQADEEGVHAYLHKPKVRGRPNSRFLTATVLGVQQANRAAEVTEMWSIRKKEIELEERMRDRSKYRSNHGNNRHHIVSPRAGTSSRSEQATFSGYYGNFSRESLTSWSEKDDVNSSPMCTSGKRQIENSHDTQQDHGLTDEQVEFFLQSRVKRGRGAVGSRMEEPGPYLPHSNLDTKGKNHLDDSEIRTKECWEQQVLVPEKPSFLEHHQTDMIFSRDTKKCEKIKSKSSKHNSKSSRSSSKRKSEPKKKKEKTPKHHHKHENQKRSK